MTERISAEMFQQRLAALCTRGGGAGLPRKQQDRHIMFQSAIMALDREISYTELELNAALIGWLEETGRVVATDHVTLRRHLVDEHYLERDPAGSTYRVAAHNDSRFDPAVLDLDPSRIVAERKADRARQRRIYTQRRP